MPSRWRERRTSRRACGIAESIRLNLALTVIELTGLLLVVATGVAALAAGSGEPGRAFTFNGRAGTSAVGAEKLLGNVARLTGGAT